MKKVFITLITVIILLLSFPLPAFAAETGDVPSYKEFEETYVLDDLTSGGVDLDSYLTKDSAALITFQEFGYNYYNSDLDDFGLYFYIYNPSSKTIANDSKSSITLAVSYDNDGKPNDYEKFRELAAREPDILKCMACGSCTASCSAGNFTELNLRKIILMLTRGAEKETVRQLESCMFCGKWGKMCRRIFQSQVTTTL